MAAVLAAAVSEAWPWLVLAGLGAFHGLNPAMGWLFAVALGLHRRSRAVVVGALAPIAFGHMLSIAVVVAVVLLLGLVVDQSLLRRAAGVDKGSANASGSKVGKVTQDQIREIAETKMKDLNAIDIDGAMKQIEGTARSMGIEVVA